MDGRGVGKKLRTNEVKIEILKYLADDHSDFDLRSHLTAKFGIQEKRGIRLHLSDLRHVKKFLNELKIKNDFGTYKKIITFLQDNQKNIDWDISEFTHKTKYGLEHITNELIDWWAIQAYNKYCETWNIVKGSIKPDNALNIVLGGTTRDQLLRMLTMSPSVFWYIFNVGELRFKSEDGKYPIETRNKILEYFMRDILSENSDLLNPILYNAHIGLVSKKMKEYRNGLRVELAYEVFPKIKLKKEMKNANS